MHVEDVNEYIPLWSEEEYSAQLQEGDVSAFILQVIHTYLLFNALQDIFASFALKIFFSADIFFFKTVLVFKKYFKNK